MENKRLRNVFITVFVIVFSCVFHYESLRHFYLNPLLKRELPKVKLLFPPAGWIMFYRVNDKFGLTQVIGVKGESKQIIDPHDIFRVRTIGYDNIRRNILSVVSDRRKGPSFCRYLTRRYDYFDNFLITSIYYPSVTKTPHLRYQSVIYQCYE